MILHDKEERSLLMLFILYVPLGVHPLRLVVIVDSADKANTSSYTLLIQTVISYLFNFLNVKC